MQIDGIIIETLVGLFTIKNGKIKLLLKRKTTEPYKGYWILLGEEFDCVKSLEENINDTILKKTGLKNIEIDQCYAFSNIDKLSNMRKLTISFVGFIDSVTIGLKIEQDIDLEWFNLDDIPKIGYDHEDIMSKMIECFKKKLLNVSSLRILFPSDFTLPELQKIYEQILNKKLDRRNFRKKFLALDLIEDTGDKNEGFSGRPAKLYRFKEDLKERDLF